MKLFLAFLGILMIAAVSTVAGGLADAVVETVPVVISPDESEGSLPGWVVPAAIVAALIGVAVLSNDGDGGDAS